MNSKDEEIKNLRIALRKSENERKQLYNCLMNIPAIVVLYRGPEHFCMLSNYQHQQFVGGNYVGKKVRESIPEKILTGVIEVLDMVYQTGQLFVEKEFINIIEKEHGQFERGIFNLMIQPTFDFEGKVDGLMAFAFEITDEVLARKQAETYAKTVKKNAIRFKEIIENLDQGYASFDRELNFLSVNKKYQEMSHQSPEELIGKKLNEVYPEIVDTLFWQAAHTVLKERTTQTLEEYYPPFQKWYQTVFYPTSDGIASFTRDITERKMLEKQKDNFIGVVAHELRTPTTTMRAFVQMVQKQLAKDGNTDATVMLEKVDAQIGKFTVLIKDLLDTIKIEEGGLEFHQERFDLDTLINEIVEDMQMTTDKHMIVVEGSSRTIYADRNRIGQVLINLLSNAIKYSPDADKIIVRKEIVDNTVKVAVTDFGVGIPSTMQANLFNRYFRVIHKKYATFSGIGLGLYIASEIISKHGGVINVQSKEGKGSTFSFALPIEAKIAKSPKQTTETSPPLHI